MDWRTVKGYPSYEVSKMGEVRRVRNGKYTLMTPTFRHRKTADYVGVKLTDETGKRKEFKVSYLVAWAFLPPKPGPEYVLVHRNGDLEDNCAHNLAWYTRKELGKRFGAQAGRIPVAKINRDGEVVEVYSSARAAAKVNFMSYQTLMDRCNGKVKNEFELSGYTFRWDK